MSLWRRDRHVTMKHVKCISKQIPHDNRKLENLLNFYFTQKKNDMNKKGYLIKRSNGNPILEI